MNDVENNNQRRDSFYQEDVNVGTELNKELNTELNKINIKQEILNKNTQVDKYILELLNMVKRRNENCFVKGAFVILVPNYALFNLLLTHMNDEIKPNFRSHMMYNHVKMSDNENNKKNWLLELNQQITANNTNKNEKKFNLTFVGPCEVWINPIKFDCEEKCDAVTYKNVKWYPFPGINGKNHIYLKLEGFPTMSSAHLIQWIKRHAIKKIFKEKTKKKVCKTYREDCLTEKNCRYDKNTVNNEFNLNHLNDPFTYNKIGDEVFVSENENKTLLLLSSPLDGGRKTRNKIRRKTRNKIRRKTRTKKS